MDQTAPRSIPRRRFLRTAAGATRRDGLLARSPQGSRIRSEARADLPQLEPLRPRRRRRAPQAGGGLRQGEQLHGARGHHGAPADAGQDRGRGPVAVGPRHVPDRERRSVPLREPPRQHGRPGRQAGQGGRRLVSVRGGELPDQVRLEGDPLVLGVVPGHLQHGALQEGGVRRSAEDVGRPPEDGQGAQEAGQPGRHPDQPLLGRPLDLLVGGVVLRRPRCSRPTARPRRSARTRPSRSSSGTRSSTRTRWSPRSCPGTTPATTASSSPARAPGSTIRSAPTTPPSPTSSPSPTTSITTTARRARRASTRRLRT